MVGSVAVAAEDLHRHRQAVFFFFEKATVGLVFFFFEKAAVEEETAEAVEF